MTKWRGNPWAILVTLSLGFFMTLLDLTIVNIAIPNMISALGASLDEILWIVNAYVLVLAVLLITAGRLGDLRGQRTLFAIGVATFTVASFACGVAPNATLLIIFRAIQGLGAALLMPQTMALIIATFPAERRGTALGIWGAVAGLATVAGPTLGGLLVTWANWRWIFFVNIPVGVVVLVLTFVVIPDTRMERTAPARHPRRGPRDGRAVLPDLRVDRGAAVLLERRDHVALRGLRHSLRGLPAAAAQPSGPRAAGAVRAVPRPQLRGDQRDCVPRLDRDPRLLPAADDLPAVRAGLLGAQGRPGAGAELGDRHGARADRRPDVGPGGRQVHPDGRADLLRHRRDHDRLHVAGRDVAGRRCCPAPLVLGLGFGGIFAPMATETMRSVDPRMAGAASGVNNTIRQVGSVVGSAAVGAVLQARLATTLHQEAVARASQLPQSARGQFLAGLAKQAKGGIDVGSTQKATAPQGIPAQLAAELDRHRHRGLRARLRPGHAPHPDRADRGDVRGRSALPARAAAHQSNARSPVQPRSRRPSARFPDPAGRLSLICCSSNYRSRASGVTLRGSAHGPAGRRSPGDHASEGARHAIFDAHGLRAGRAGSPARRAARPLSVATRQSGTPRAAGSTTPP